MLKKVLVVPKINKNLLSVSKFAKDNCCSLEFDETNFVVQDKRTRTLLDKGSKRNGLYALEDNNLYSLTAAHGQNTSNNMCHTRLGHPNLNYLKFLSSNSCINVSSQNKMPTVCSICQLRKSCKLHFYLRNKIEKEPLLKIHRDSLGPAPVESSQHMKYYVIFFMITQDIHGFID